jgi:hypothetical protein
MKITREMRRHWQHIFGDPKPKATPPKRRTARVKPKGLKRGKR